MIPLTRLRVHVSGRLHLGKQTIYSLNMDGLLNNLNVDQANIYYTNQVFLLKKTLV